MPKTKQSREKHRLKREAARKRYLARKQGLAMEEQDTRKAVDWEPRIDRTQTFHARSAAQAFIQGQEEAGRAEAGALEPFPCEDHWHLWEAPPRMAQSRVDDIVEQRMIEASGQRLSPADVGSHFNQTYCPEGWHPVSTGDVLESMERLAQQGRLLLLKPSERYRKNHAWVHTMPEYGLPV